MGSGKRRGDRKIKQEPDEHGGQGKATKGGWLGRVQEGVSKQAK
jgi:hypothetical protein